MMALFGLCQSFYSSCIVSSIIFPYLPSLTYLSLQVETLERAMTSLTDAERTAALQQVEREEGLRTLWQKEQAEGEEALSKQYERHLEDLRNTLTADFKVRVMR
jgi:TorA maturation chaperone TorD